MEAAVIMGLLLLFFLSSVYVPVAIGMTVIVFTLLFPIGDLSFIAMNTYSGLFSYPLLAIPFFCLVGEIMGRCELSSQLVNLANKLVGNRTSALALVTVAGCLFFGAISGSAPATVAAIGSIMYPQMVKAGYHKKFAAGLIAIAGGLGIIIPPSIPMVVYGVGTQTSIGDLFLAGIFPGLTCGGLLMLVAWYIGKKRGYKGSGEIASLSLMEKMKAVWDAKWALVLPVIILGGIYGGIFTPTEAGVVGCVYAIAVGKLVYKQLTLKDLFDSFVENASVVGIIFLTIGVANSLSLIISFFEVPTALGRMITLISENKHAVLGIITALVFVLGMFMDTMSMNIIFSPLFLAIVQPLGVDPIHFGIIMTVGVAIGFVTPPIASNLYLTSALTQVPVADVIKESMPFVLAVVVAWIIITYVPILSIGIVQLVR